MITFVPQMKNIHYFEDHFGPSNCVNQTEICVSSIGFLTRAVSICENYSIGMLVLVILAFIAGILTMLAISCVDFYVGEKLIENNPLGAFVAISGAICVMLNLAALICVLYGNGTVWNTYSQHGDNIPALVSDFVHEIIQNGIPTMIMNVLACCTFSVGLFWL
jgi:hypothetical protein